LFSIRPLSVLVPVELHAASATPSALANTIF
jgi:hypothetical protein